MAKTSSPVKRGAGGGGGGSSTAASQSSGSGSRDGGNASGSTGADDLQLTERTERVESTIVSRENATHAAFAASRTRDFIYAASSHYLHLINDYCDSAPDGSSASSGVSSLLVVVGQPGMGKSALLAHWAAQRRTSEAGAHEFIYEHYCGCSYDSVKLSLFLFRLMNQLKITYALRDFELPREHDEEKLKFSFARCLEAAVGRTNQRAGGAGASSSSRRNIVLVLDGIDCLRTEDGGDSLSWMPNSFPSGVRIIVSATHRPSAALLTRLNSKSASGSCLQSAQLVVRKPVAYDGDGDLIYDTTLPPSDQDSHTIRELRRRRTSFIVVEPLDEPSCRAIVQLYNTHAATSPLAPDEQDAIVSAPGSSSPLYLRLVLRGQELFDDTGRGKAARHAWLDRVSRTRELHVVYELLMRRWTDILLEDLEEQQQKMMNPPPEADAGGESGPGKLVRRATKRDVVAAATQDQGQGHGRPGLSRTPSMRSNGAAPSPHAGVPGVHVDPAEWEALQIALEQRVLLVRHTLSLLAVSRYGLSETDLQRLLGDAVPKAICQKLLLLLRPHVMRIRRHDCGSDEVVLLDLSHNQLRLLVRFGFLSDDHLRGCYYKELALYFGGLEASQRRLDELPVQLERCGMWSALQAALVDIKMFQLWWSERNRQEFFSYWMVLRTNCSIHDPVDDFIRSLDEFIIHEAPSAEQLLALCLTITDFLRAWQRFDDSRSSTLTLARPAPPQLNEFMTSLGGISSTAAHLSEHEAKRVHAEIDAQCIHKDDAYFVRRWLWTQFPLIGIAFESRFLRSFRPAAPPESTSAGRDHEVSSNHSASSADTASSGKNAVANASILPKSLHAKAVKNALIQSSTKRKPSLLFQGPGSKDKEFSGGSGASGGFDMLPSSTSDDGAFEFVSTENTELTVGSVSKFETQVVDLRVKYDKLKFTAKERQAALKVLDSRLMDARAQVQAASQSASQVDDLLDQIRHINDETVLGRQRSDYYKAILRHCEIHPARDPNCIEVTETAVNKMKQEIVELQQKTQVVSYEARLASIESKKLQQVIEDKTAIHNTALERLRWRYELMQRMLKQHRDGDAAKAEQHRDEDDEDANNNDTSHREDAEDGGEGEDEGGNNHHRSRKQSSTVVEFNRAKDKLLHKKETSLERLRKVDQLKVYVGSPFKDDGVLGALRQVGINKPEEAHLYWQDQQQHAVQLEAEEKSLELRVVEYREKLSSLQTQLVNLKLGGASASTNTHASHGADSGSGAVSGGHGSGSVAASGTSAAVVTQGSEPSTSAASGATSSTTHNLKQLEQHLSDAQTITQQKKERAARLKSLSERLHLGLQHVAQILGVGVTQQMESMELADAVEQVVRLYLGDEGHMQSGTSTNLRRKNSVRAMGMANQSGLHAIAPPDTRSTDEKLRYNIRVSKSPQRQMNPYVDGDREETEDVEDDEDDDDGETEDEGRGALAGGDGAERSKKNTDSVTRRADIKQRSRLEVDRKLKTPVAKQSKAKDKGKAAAKRQSVVADK